MNLLILYPKEFNCFSKFARKVTNIIGKESVERVIYPLDEDGFIHNFFKNYVLRPEMLEKKDWINCDITHAIIFDDGEEFQNEIERIRDSNILLRIIKIPSRSASFVSPPALAKRSVNDSNPLA